MLGHRARIADLDDFVGAKTSGCFEARLPTTGDGHAATSVLEQASKHQANGPGTDHERVLSRLGRAVVEPLHDARQRFGQCGIYEGSFRAEPEHVFLNEARWNDDRFCISAIQEQQIVTKVFLPVLAIEAFPAGSGIGDHDTISAVPSSNVAGHFADRAGEFMTKNRGRHDHARVIPALINLKVGAAGQGSLDCNAGFAGSERSGSNLFDNDLLFAM